MSDTLSGVKNAITSISKSVAQASGDAVKTAKLNISVSGEETALKNCYVEMGKILREMHNARTLPPALSREFDALFAQADEIDAKIADLRAQISDVKNARKAAPEHTYAEAAAPQPPYPAPPPAPSVYDAPPVEYHNPAPPYEPPRKKICSVCGAEADLGERFCLSCGRML